MSIRVLSLRMLLENERRDSERETSRVVVESNRRDVVPDSQDRARSQRETHPSQHVCGQHGVQHFLTETTKRQLTEHVEEQRRVRRTRIVSLVLIGKSH